MTLKRQWKHAHGARFLIGADGPARADDGPRHSAVLNRVLGQIRRSPGGREARLEWASRWTVTR